MELIGGLRRAGVYAKGMNFRVHHCPERVIDHPVARQRPYSHEGLGLDRYVKVAPAVPSAGMAGVQVALILYEQMRWCECGPENRLDSRDSILCHGRTLLKGFTVTLA